MTEGEVPKKEEGGKYDRVRYARSKYEGQPGEGAIWALWSTVAPS